MTDYDVQQIRSCMQTISLSLAEISEQLRRIVGTDIHGHGHIRTCDFVVDAMTRSSQEDKGC